MIYRWLSIHADYACRHSGACCSSNWTIPVEPELIAIVGPAVAGGVLPLTAEGACVFFDRAATANRCTIHRDLGVQAIPLSCRHFPRVCLIDARGVSVTLSHYCPTAAGLPFRRDRKLEIVEGPDPVPGGTTEGLDAREALPPLLSPSMLMDHDSYTRFEDLTVAMLADEAASAESALDRIAIAVERLRAWTPGSGSLEDVIAAIESHVDSAPRWEGGARLSESDHVAFEEVRGCLPPSHSWDTVPQDASTVWDRVVEERWPVMARPVRHYLAAKAFAAWPAYQGQGLRTFVRSLTAALAVVKIELVRLAEQRTSMANENLLKEAFRRADLLLVHLCDRDELARTWSRAEGGRRPYGARGSC